MLKLSGLEIAARDYFLEKMGYDGLADLEEDCCGATSYHYEVHPSGIGDSVYVVFKGTRHLISDFENI